jgi:hypothetical protein
MSGLSLVLISIAWGAPGIRPAVTEITAPGDGVGHYLTVSYSAAEARQQLLDDLASAIDALAVALVCLGAAYERLDEHGAEQVEELLFRPSQLAYGRARRVHQAFAERHGLPARRFEQATAGLESQGPRELVDRAGEAIRRADDEIAALQDSLLPVDVGDVELRAGLSAVRTTIDPLPARAHKLVRVIGR